MILQLDTVLASLTLLFGLLKYKKNTKAAIILVRVLQKNRTNNIYIDVFIIYNILYHIFNISISYLYILGI